MKSSVWLFCLFIFNLSSLLFAEKMDLSTHNLVIEKLESTLKNLSGDNSAVNMLGLRLQLANLYSEKARLLLVEEGSLNCDLCKGSSTFRQKAIDTYERIHPKLTGVQADQVAIQWAYLLEQTNKNKQALNIYNKLINSSQTDKKIKIQSYIKRGLNYFRDGQLNLALADFQTVIRFSPSESQGPTIHKIAWVYYNQGEIEKAQQELIRLLKNKSLLVQPSGTGFEYSESFHIEVAKDLALFISKTPFSNSDVQTLISLSPPNEIINNLLFLGDEAERVGQSSSAPLAWEQALKVEGFAPEKKLPVLMSLSRYYRDNFKYEKAHSYFGQAAKVAQSCGDACGSESSKSFKLFLTQFEKLSTRLTKPELSHSAKVGLMNCYITYHQYFNTDYETYLWLAQLSLKLNQKEISRKSYSRASDLLAEIESNDKGTLSTRKLMNGSLLKEIELSEAQSDLKIQLGAYDHYLKLNPKGSESSLVRYQRAKIFYDQNNSKEAFQLFDEIVNDSTFNRQDLKLKSAHLSLDSLVLLKKIELLEEKSLSYSRIFPRESAEFHQISRQAGLDIAKSFVQKDTSVSAAESALEKLGTVTLQSSTSQETKNYLKMKIDLSLSAQKWVVAQKTLSEYLKRQDLNAGERNWGLTKKLSISELLLDFRESYNTLIALKYDQSSNPAFLLKGALIAELNHMAAKPWLEKVIRSKSATSSQTLLARAQLVRTTEHGRWKELHRHSSFLKNSPSLFADLALECFAFEPNVTEARWALSTRGASSSVSGQKLQGSLTLDHLKSLAIRMKNQKINQSTDSKLSHSIQERLSGLSELKRNLQVAQKNGNWAQEVISATFLKRENEHLASEIERIQAPKKLSAREKIIFQKTIQAQSFPFRKSADELKEFLSKSWSDQEYLDLLLKGIEVNHRIRSILMKEMALLASIAPSDVLGKIESTLNDFKNRPSVKEIASTQDELRNDPFDLSLQEQLLVLEKKRGNQSMVVFLEARGQSLKGGRL